MNPADIADDNNWIGGYYELAFDLGVRDDQRLDAALKLLWQNVAGCFYGGVFRGQRKEAPCTLESVERAGALCGVIASPLGEIVCGGQVVRFDESNNDWLALVLPLGALKQLEPRIAGFPFGDAPSLPWRQPLDDWLVEMARKLHPQMQFHRALVGFEVSYDSGEIPSERYEGVLTQELRYYPATK